MVSEMKSMKREWVEKTESLEKRLRIIEDIEENTFAIHTFRLSILILTAKTNNRINIKSLISSTKVEMKSCEHDGYKYFHVKATPNQWSKVQAAFNNHTRETVSGPMAATVHKIL
jgi:predicted nucleotidyltransferase